MNSLTTLSLFALLVLTRAADPIDADTGDCAIKSAEGDYNYDPTGGKGPADWGSLKPEYSACSEGKSQSPIDFPTDVKYAPLADGPKPMLMGNVFKFSAGASNWALSCVTEGSCGTTMFGGLNFTLFNIHFHAPSEHTLDGVQYPLEAHFVHIGPNSELAVIATMFKFPDEDEYSSKIYRGGNIEFGKSGFIGTILKGVEKNKGEFEVFPGAVIDANKGYCVFSGSLTTPPCSEGVTFLMSNNVVSVSERQVHRYAVSAGANFDGNNRPVQPLNNRTVTCYV